VLRRYYRAARDVFERHGGTVEKFVGDAVLAVFGVPTSHEDDALRAVRAAVALRGGVAELNTQLEQAHGVALRTRMGVNTGEAIAGEPESGQSFATGYAVNIAAKLQQAAPVGEILVGAATYRLVQDAVTAEPIAPLELGGAAAPIPAFRIAEVDPEAPGVARNLEAPLVGRSDELAALRDAFGAAKDAGACRLAIVIGEAGIGKSRLAAELAALLEGEGTVLIGRCVSYGEGATYLPVAEVVRRLVPDGSEVGIAALLPDDADARLVARRIRELLGWAEGAPPPGEGFWAVRRLLEAVGHARPLLLVLEDVHWAEPTLLDLVDHLAEHAAAPMLVLCLARPDLLESRPSWEARVLSRLAPLSDEESAELVDNLADVPAETRARIVAVAEGNALFVEQLHAHAVEAGETALAGIPPTIDALLASRLDRLPEPERAVLERAAVVGREFWRGAVDDLSERSAQAELEALAGKGFVRPARSLLEGEKALAFHHVLIRDVAYAGITKERRSKLHERVAAWLDAREPGWDELVGYHLEQAYRLRAELAPVDEGALALAEAAGGRLAAAGIRAWKRADAPATVNLLGRARTLLPVGERRGEVLCELAVALRSVGDGAAVVETLEEALRDASAMKARRVVLRARVEIAHAGLYGVGALRAAPEDVLDVTSSAIPVLEEMGDERALARTWLAVGDVHCMRVNNRAWGEAATTALRHYRRSGWSASVCFSSQAAALFYGRVPVPEAIRRCLELLDDAGDDRHAVASVSLFTAGLHAMQRRFAEARRLADQAGATFEASGARLTLAAAHSAMRAEIERLAGDLPAAEAILRGSCEELDAMGQRAYLAIRAAQLADVLCDQGRLEEAHAQAQIAERNRMESDPIFEVHRLSVRARLLARGGVGKEAEASARRAVALLAETDAVNQRAKSLLDLADVLRVGGQSSEEIPKLIAQARRLFSRKGNLVGAYRARSLVDELSTTPA